MTTQAQATIEKFNEKICKGLPYTKHNVARAKSILKEHGDALYEYNDEIYSSIANFIESSYR